MAEYFVEFRPADDSNLYLRFVRNARPIIREIHFSTLNYDLLFVDALSVNGLSVDYFEKSSDKVPFWKLHGSCNFLPQGIIDEGNIFINCPVRF